MPTENRSSTIEQHDHIEGIIDMVSVPRHTLENILKDGSCKPEVYASFRQADQDIRALLDQPAQQPHAEPIAWMVGTAIWWTKEEAERDAEAMGLPVISVGPIGDIELAREMLRRADRREGKWARLCAGRNNQIAELRAQLAEAQEVLRDCIEVGELNAETEWKALRVSKGRRLYVDDRALSALEVQP
ncbi:hypothetical protein SAMN02745900_04427 [Pseudomonas sp. URIL14HWK12:I8]|uniref:hypothetical protein n=1 Tax=unclassified Pseudomonas TaxID=196821 RepID=UPI00067F32DC|nr:MULTISPECIES: hypothetical protein [unclassified Pseudomonas]SNB84426.1 hypothetical protein SAMN02745900_04427 [Pseudomonas sp. URIL14HWK12:I8]